MKVRATIIAVLLVAWAGAALAQPTVVAVTTNCGTPRQVLVEFSADMDRGSAERKANYDLPGSGIPGLEVTGAVLGSDLRTVTLTLNKDLLGGSYSLEISDVEETAGAVLAPNPTTSPFVYCPVVGGGIDHFTIDIGAASASTCAAKGIVLSAWDASDNLLTSYAGTVAIATSAGHGDWAVVAAAGTLGNGTADDGEASYTFVSADNGSVTLSLANEHADDLTVSAVDQVAPGTLSVSAVASYRDNAFVLGEDPIQVAGRDQAISVALWRRDATSGDCAVASDYAGNTGLKAWLSRDGDDPGGAAPKIGALSLPDAMPGSDNLTLNFASGQATFSLATTDVGKYAVNLRDDGSGFAVDELGNPRPIDGGSATLTTRPFGLHIGGVQAGATANPGADTPAGGVFTAAGGDFAATVRGVRWAAGDDSDDDGIPDAGANLADNAATASYAWETILSAGAPYQPAAGVLGSLANGTLSAATFSGGAATAATLRYSEVGSVTLSALASSFLNSAGVNVSGPDVVVGRFIPDHFAVAGNVPRFRTACAAGSFTSLGQPFTYETAPVLTVTAQNAQNGTTVNYTGSWWRITDASLSGKAYAAAAGTLDTGLVPVPDPVIADTGAGTGTLSFSAGGGLAFVRGAATAPFDAEIALSIDVLDLDGVAYAANPAAFGAASAGNGIAFDNGKTMRHGRLTLHNAHGSELSPLTMPLRAEYFDGSGYVTNALDSCTAYDAADAALGNYRVNLNTGETVAAGGGILAGGREDGGNPLLLSAPGGGNDGSVDVTLDVDPWLEDGADPVGRASFGVYKGDPELIFMRESVP